MSRTAAAPRRSTFGQFWHKWRFHLNVALVVIPLSFMPHYFAENARERGDAGLGERIVGDIAVGPWSLTLAEPLMEGPQPSAGQDIKSFHAALCKACVNQVKATYLRIGKPRSLRAAGVIFFGSGYRMFAGLPIPTRTPVDSELWITMEGWDGSMHQASIPLSQASPATIAWLNAQGNTP
ncbi:thiamine pyrophosphate-binding protein [Pseudomonas sp. UBA4194]|uniref:thiamine pyrophosphate-binding protein n=1 Tax=Pseudomonas sp. UBA4194 TaxID=1947317 RepID=UPI0025D155AD|nr:thiamine pyrophosphate-binding protein [Pseudomonas sp. UBA4194]